jgi:caffeoyl-CoA O-methyltransferase
VSAAARERAVSAPGAARPVTPVGILAARLADLAARAAAGESGPALSADLHAAHRLAAGLESYARRFTTPESPALRELAAMTAAHDWSAHPAGVGQAALEQEMLSGHVEGQLLKTLVHATRARRVLDIGMFTGYSALAVAEALPPGGRVVACEVDAAVATFARDQLYRTAAGKRVDVRVGAAEDTLADLAAGSEVFDLVFVDADKAGYFGYVDAILRTGLLADHGLICVDNTLLQGLPWTDEDASANSVAIAEFNRAIAADPRVEQVVLAVRDGITLIHPSLRSWM